MRKMIAASMLLGLLILGAVPAWAQDETPTMDQALSKSWNGINDKLIDIAKDFPENKFDFRQHSDSKSFLELVWHCTSSAEAVAVVMSGEKPDYSKIFSNDGRPSDRAGLVASLEKASQASAKAIEGKTDPSMVGWIEHSGEQYGKLVAMYRANGLVPPLTRQRQKQQEEARKKKEKEENAH